jgi:hypothetical protein
MAITRAQQVRQMLEDGGMLVQPSMTGKRPGYRGRGAKDPREVGFDAKEAAASRRGSGVGSTYDAPTGAPDDKFKTEPKKEEYEGFKEMGFVDEKPIVPIPSDTTKDFRDKQFEPPTFPPGAAFVTNIFKKPLQAGMTYDRNFFVNKVLKAGRLGLTPLEFSKLSTDEQEEVFDKFTELRNAGLTDAYGNLKTGVRREMIPFKKADGTIEMREQIIDNRDDGPRDQILFPQNMPGDPSDPGDGEGDDDDDTNKGGLAIRFRKDGGRINANEGGIMKASYGYDDAMGEAFEEFLRLKKIREIPEDMEFDEYLDQLDIDVPYSRKDRREQRTMAQEGGIMDLETGRQMYFLGKLVKKATRAVKKITKSPLGKAAILGGLAYFGGGGASIFKNKGLGGLFSNFFSKKNPLLFDAAGKLSMGKLAGLSAISPFLFQQEEEDDDEFYRGPGLDTRKIRENPYDFLGPNFANGGRIGYQEGSKEPVAKKTMPLLDMGGKEMDLRDNGGFVPIGRMEKADDVPARLSKNEFVFTADAVRNAGEGDVDKGAEVMYNMMKNLESGGEVSEESQGLEGARRMFQTSKRLEEVL